MENIQVWNDWFLNPVQHNRCIGLFAYPGEPAYAFSSSLEASPEIEDRWILQPFHSGGGVPGFSIPMQNKLRLDELNRLSEENITGAWESSMRYSLTSKSDFLEGVKAIQNQIGKAEGKLVMSIRNPIQLKAFSPVQSFTELRNRYPKALVWFLSCPIAGTWVGASPEVLLSQSAEGIESWSLAGTRQVDGPTWTRKELQEQALVTKYLHQALLDFGLEPKFQKEPEEFQMGNLLHLRTRIFSRFSSDFPDEELARLAAHLHPSPAVGGYPSDEVFERIARIERQSRAYYSGYFGWKRPGQTRLYVNLRCAEIQQNQAIVFAGAGITSESVPEAEWVEVQKKADLLLNALR
jgi:isochorismate synthase